MVSLSGKGCSGIVVRLGPGTGDSGLRGESMLIHAVTRGLAQAMLTRLAQHLGAGAVFATCDTPEKRELRVRKYELQEEDIFQS